MWGLFGVRGLVLGVRGFEGLRFVNALLVLRVQVLNNKVLGFG